MFPTTHNPLLPARTPTCPVKGIDYLTARDCLVVYIPVRDHLSRIPGRYLIGPLPRGKPINQLCAITLRLLKQPIFYAPQSLTPRILIFSDKKNNFGFHYLFLFFPLFLVKRKKRENLSKAVVLRGRGKTGYTLERYVKPAQCLIELAQD